MPSTSPLYQRLAAHYLDAIRAGTLAPGARLPSLRELMRQHGVSLSTAMQLCRTLEDQGWVQARARAGYFVQHKTPVRRLAPIEEPATDARPDPAQYVGIHARVSDFVARSQRQPIRINFSTARAAPQLYPAEALRAALARGLRHQPEMLAQGTPAHGHAAFRAVLARRALQAGMTLAPEDILVTQGCIEALNLALRAVAQPGDTIAVESPTFYGLLQVLESLGLRALEIPTSPQTGLSIEALEFALDAHANLRAVVVVPHLQNPLGCVMPEAHKERLLALCTQRGIALIEDDTYSELLDAADPPPRAIKSWDRAGGVIHCASLHKVLAPGLRLGWISAGRWQRRVEMLKYAQTRNNEGLAQMAAAEVMGGGVYERHLRRLRTALGEQRARTAEAIAQHFPEGTRMNMPPGGLQLWVELPKSCSANALFDAALAEGILLAPGALFSNSARFEHYVRINCGWPWSAEIEQALRTVGRLVRG